MYVFGTVRCVRTEGTKCYSNIIIIILYWFIGSTCHLWYEIISSCLFLNNPTRIIIASLCNSYQRCRPSRDLPSLFPSFEGQQRAANGQHTLGVFQGCTKHCVTGCRLARRLHQLKAFTTMDLGIIIILLSVSSCVALRNLGLRIITRLERDLSALLLRTLGVGGQAQLFSLQSALVARVV